MAQIGARFRGWKACVWRKSNQPAIAEAVFDLDKRSQLFSGAEQIILPITEISDDDESPIGFGFENGTGETSLQECFDHLAGSAQMRLAIQWFNSLAEARAKERLIREHAYRRISELAVPLKLAALSIDDFDRHILKIGGLVYSNGIPAEENFLPGISASELRAMFQEGKIHTVGNCTWGFGTATIRAAFARAGVKDDAVIQEKLQFALRELQNDACLFESESTEFSPIPYTALAQSGDGAFDDSASRQVDCHERQITPGTQAAGLETAFKHTVENYVVFTRFARQVQSMYGLHDLAEVDAFFSHYVDLSPEERERILELFGKEGPIITILNPPYPLTQCTQETGVDEATLARWVRAIHRKGRPSSMARPARARPTSPKSWRST